MNSKEAYLHHLVITCDNESVKRLLENGDININVRDEKGNHVIHKATKKRNVELLKLLLEAGANINSVNFELNSALHVAIENHAVDCVKLLLEKNIIVNIINSKEESELIIALKLSEVFRREKDEIIKLLSNFEAYDLKMELSGRKNYLHYACWKGNHFLATKLITEYPELHARDYLNDYPIHFAVWCGHNSVANLMFERIPKLNINLLGAYNWTMLLWAASRTQLATIELLVSKGANCNFKRKD
ncbi:E3 ubiquitin-protein ligase MIB2-like isoform X2, partial [Leptotrombidium deliense]